MRRQIKKVTLYFVAAIISTIICVILGLLLPESISSRTIPFLGILTGVVFSYIYHIE